MPVIIPQNLPANEILAKENIFVINEHRALHQDIRPLRIAIVNLMPTKITTETQLLRLLSNMPIQIDVELVCTKSHQPKNTSLQHMFTFYKTFEEIKDQRFDGMIITGAPVENMPFEDVDYWQELEQIMNYSVENVFSTLHICWGAQAALYHHYGIAKYNLPAKMFGVFKHTVNDKKCELVRGYDDEFYIPHSRHTEVRRADILKVPDLEIISESKEAGVYLVVNKELRQIFAMGHAEYDPLVLKNEYDRDIAAGLKINTPDNYFPQDDPTKEPIVRWRGHANLLFSNWLNYYVYQETPFDLNQL